MGAFSGPNATKDNLYNHHVCTTSGTFIPNFSGNVEVLVVAGGGGGGMDMGGGGGAGGVVYNSAFAVTSGTSYTVTIGAGGVGAPAAYVRGQAFAHQFNISATQGGNSVFGSITAIGGGYGGSSYYGYTPNYGLGGSGGSGGGSSGYTAGATTTGASGTAGQGNKGGNAGGGSYYSGGGGGAGAAGADGPNQANGGAGVLNAILGYPLYWGGGGGGGAYNAANGGNGGIGGGGGGAGGISNGGEGYNNGESGSASRVNNYGGGRGGNGGANTGGGGGGGTHYNTNTDGGNGGSGIVIIRYLKSLGTSTFNGIAAAPQVGLLLNVDAAELSSVEVLVVAGGGGGGNDMGGGGAGGGVIYRKAYQVALNSAITVTVGSGGAGATGYASNPLAGGKGGNSVFGLLTAIGGGGGGSGHYYPAPYAGQQGQPGGSGGGDSPLWGRNRFPDGGEGTPGQGYNGGAAAYGSDGWYGAGGGGGAGSRGSGGGYGNIGGNGGRGFYSDINGTGYYWGGGGGGAHHENTGGNGGVGGGGGGSGWSGGTAGTGGGSALNSGGNGVNNTTASVGGAGGTNTGGGGGGGGHQSTGGAGGSGIVIVRYYGSTKATGGTITSAGGYTVHTFTSSGTFTPTSYLDPSDNGQLKRRINNIGGTYSSSNLGLITLNGSSNYLSLDGDVTFKTTGGWSVESVFRLASVSPSSLYNFIGASSINYNSWYWTVYQSKLALWNLSPGGWYYGSTTIEANKWYHVVLVCNEAGTGYQFYLNGVAETGGHETYSWNASYAGLMIGFIGRGDVSNGRYFNGDLPITKVYNYPLSADNVRQNFRALGSRFGFISPTLYYDEGANAAAFTANWNNSTTYTMVDFGGLGNVTAHGFTSGPVTFTLTLNNLPPHQKIRYKVFWHLVDSLDNETNQLFIMNLTGGETEVYRFTKQYNLAPSASIAAAGLTTTWYGGRSYTYRPWANGAYGADGFIDIDTGYQDHTSSTFTARHVMGADQAQADEAQYLSHVQVWIS